MENNKKQQNFSRTNSSKTFQTSEINRKNNIDIQPNKPWPRNTRRREQNQLINNNDQQRDSKQYTTTKNRNYADKRPRARGDANNTNSNNNSNKTNNSIASVDYDLSITSTGLASEELVCSASTGAVPRNAKLKHELNSVYSPGSKKQSLNHLLNFHCTPHESDYSLGLNMFGRGNFSGNAGGVGGSSGNLQRQYQSNKKHKYNKEQFLQANFQFVIKSCAKPSMSASPDTLIDWSAIEQIVIQTSEEPQCPICLYPPIAAKLTRCGHVYCWPCILHYLALSDKKWRKCPICYEAVHINDLKSTQIIQQRAINVNNEITLHLMRRKKSSMFVEKFKAIENAANGVTEECFPAVSGNDEAKLFSKFLIANKMDILNIMEREHRDLTIDDDETCPEFLFIQQALDLLKERRENLGEIVAETANEKTVNIDKEQPIAVANDNDNDNENDTETSEQIVEKSHAATDGVGEIAAAAAIAPMTKYYYFYQSDDGQNIYLHPLNVKMLQACYGNLEQAPRTITARILQKEQLSMNEEQRRKFTCLGHLPLTCQFSVVEVDLQPPVVSGGILKLFKEDLLHRKKERQRREREERKREKKINEINDRQMGKLIASTANLNLGSTYEFPTCGFEESLIGIEAEQAALATSSSPKSTKSVSYSAVIAEGENTKSKIKLWPTLGSPSTNRNLHQNMYQELSTWSNKAPRRSAATERTSESESMMSAHELDNSDDAYNWMPTTTNFGDIFKEALSHKKQNINNNNNNNNNNGTATVTAAAGVTASNGAVGIGVGANSAVVVGGIDGGCAAGNGVANKKHKKAKKMLPLFSTGMNYNGN